MDNQTRELIENVIAISQSIESIVASLKISLASLPLVVESGLKITFSPSLGQRYRVETPPANR